MTDDLFHALEGRWFLQYSGCPLWQKKTIREVTYRYKAIHRGEELVLEDRVEFLNRGRMRFRWAYDLPVEGIPNTFRWKGLGVNRAFRRYFEVLEVTEDYLVLFFEKTLVSPTALDIATRSRRPEAEVLAKILDKLAKNPNLTEFVNQLEKVKQTEA